MPKFDIRIVKDYLQSIDLTQGLKARNALEPEEAEPVMKAIKHQLSEYLDSIYAPAVPEKKPEPKKDEPSHTADESTPDKKSPSSK